MKLLVFLVVYASPCAAEALGPQKSMIFGLIVLPTGRYKKPSLG
jgi:hypothetical protein